MFKSMARGIAGILILFAYAALGSIETGAQAGTVSGFDVEYVPVERTHMQRVLRDLVPGRYWLLYENFGLGLLDEPVAGDLRITMFPIGSVEWAIGPDSHGIIYLTGYADPEQKGIYVFNCATLTVGDFHPIEGFAYIHDVGLSADESKLYVAASAYRGPGEGFTPGEYHPDSGLLLEIDIDTFEVRRRALIGQDPDCIHVSDDYVYVDTGQWSSIYSQEDEPELGMGDYIPSGSLTDSVDTANFERVRRFSCGEAAGFFVDWSDEGGLFAQCNPMLAGITTRPEYDDGLWIFDPGVNAVVSTFGVVDDTGFRYGVSDAVVSKVYPGVIYVVAVSPDYFDFTSKGEYNLMAVDMQSGEFLAGTMLDFYPEHIYELDDGRLLVNGVFETGALVRPVD